MKTRLGFVSNSSTSSFLLLGVALEDPKEIPHELLDDEDIKAIKEDEDFNVGELYNLKSKYKLDVFTEEYTDTFLIGKQLLDTEDCDYTIDALKAKLDKYKEIEAELNRLFPNKKAAIYGIVNTNS